MSKNLEEPLTLSHEPVAKMHLTPHIATVRILLTLVGGTVVWGIYFMLVYSLTSLTCVWNWFGIANGGSGNGLKVTQLIATIIAVGIIAYFAFVDYREWRAGKSAGQDEEAETMTAADPMLAFVALLTNLLYILIIVASLVPIFVVPVCFR